MSRGLSMWFLQQREHGHKLLIWLLGLSCLCHCILYGLLFLSEQYWLVQTIVFRHNKSRASVSVIHGSALSDTSLQVAPLMPVASTSVKSIKDAPTPGKSVVSPLQPEKQKVKEPATQKKELEKAKKTENKRELDQPVFSELKKKYTSLNKKKHETKKEQTPPVKKEVEKKVQSTQKKNKEKKETVVREEHKQETILQPNTGQIAQATMGKEGNAGTSTNVEYVAINLDEAPWSPNEEEREFAKFFNPPPGFDGHESFTISFEIKEGKASYVYPRGSEPLVLYAAAKDAIMKMKFAIKKYTEKRVYII